MRSKEFLRPHHGSPCGEQHQRACACSAHWPPRQPGMERSAPGEEPFAHQVKASLCALIRHRAGSPQGMRSRPWASPELGPVVRFRLRRRSWARCGLPWAGPEWASAVMDRDAWKASAGAWLQICTDRSDQTARRRGRRPRWESHAVGGAGPLSYDGGVPPATEPSLNRRVEWPRRFVWTSSGHLR